MKGLRILKSMITEEEEEALISYIDSQKWDNRFTRRTQYYGIDYHHRTRNLVKIGPIPDELVPKQVSSLITPEAIIVNEYEDGQSISKHRDALCWGNRIVIVSLLSDTVMKLHGDLITIGIKLPRCSILILEDDARYKIEHSIDHKGSRRVSLTYRTVAPNVTVVEE